MKIKCLPVLANCLLLVTAINSYSLHNNLLAEKLYTKPSKKNKRNTTVSFIYHNEDLVDIINELAALKGINVVLPTGAKGTEINAKVTIAIPQKLTVNEAWDVLYTVLDVAGYSLNKKNDYYIVIKNPPTSQTNAINSPEPFPVYINTPPDELPNTDERIRYMYYLSNIKASSEASVQINTLFGLLMPSDAVMKIDRNTNGVLVAAKSQDIKSFMHILRALDETEFKESYDIIHLSYTQASIVASMFNDSLLKSAQASGQRYHLDARLTPEGSYFSGSIRIIPDIRTNSLIILGRAQTLERVRDFIFKYIDVQMESGESILHVYELQYLDAQSFKIVLEKIVAGSRTGGTEQSKAGQAKGGSERFFDEVIIQADTPPEATEKGEVGQYSGGNKIIVAARNDDWKHIKKIIEQLDKPQPQVIIEVLIADLILGDRRNLGSLTRNPADIPFPGNASVQTAMIGQVVLDATTNGVTNPDALDSLTGVNSDLNAITVQNTDMTTTTPPPPAIVSTPNNLFAGTSVIALSDCDGRTWSLMEVFKLFDNAKIISHPHLIAINNKPAMISVGQTRLVVDAAAPSTSGITLRKESLPANLTVTITPRISSANTVNLQVVIDIDQFINPNDTASGNRINRDVVTNANVKSGDILALGGLTTNTAKDSTTRTPWLSDIPILGWFFKRRQKEIREVSITVFITPTIIQPKLRAGVGAYTKEYIEIAEDYGRQGGLFDNLRDPITRWFFRSGSEAPAIAYRFLERKEEEFYYEEDIFGRETKQKVEKDQPLVPVVNTLTPLKNFLVDEENPLKKNPKNIEGPPRIKEMPQPTQLKNKATPPPSSTTTPKPAQDQGQAKKNKAYPQRGKIMQKQTIQEHTKEAAPKTNNNLKDLLQTQNNPLTAPAA